MKSSEPATSFSARVSRVFTKRCAPSARASSSFAGRGGEGRDLGAEDARELDGEVSQSADADDAHARRRIDAVGAQRDCRR